MNIDEVKQKMIEKYPDTNFGEFSKEYMDIYDRKENRCDIECLGECKTDKEITTFYLLIISDFKDFYELEDEFICIGSHINREKYYFGEIVLFHLDDSNNIKRTYAITIPSKVVLRPFSVIKDNKEIWGYGIPEKVVVVPPKYEEVREFGEGVTGILAAVKLNDKWGFIDTMGNEVIPLIYDAVFDFCYDERSVEREITFDFKNEWSENLFRLPQKFRQLFVPVKLNNKWGFVNRQGEITVPIKYDEVFSFLLGYALVKSNGKWSFIDRFGECTYETDFDEINGQYEWFPAVRDGDKWGYITRDGKKGTYQIYDYAFPFKMNFAIVQANGKWGYIEGSKHLLEELEEMSKHFTYNSIEEVRNAIDSKFVIGKLKQDSYRYW